MTYRYRKYCEEYVFLLELALSWWKRAKTRTNDRSFEFLEDIRILIIVLHSTPSDITPPKEGWNLTNLSTDLLQQVTDSLLDSKKQNDAEEICKRFKFRNINLLTIESAFKFAKGEYESFSSFPEKVIRSLTVEQRQTIMELEDKPSILEILATSVSHGKELIYNMITQFKVAILVNVPFDRLSTLEHYTTLKLLIRENHLDEARDFIDLFNLIDNRVTLLLADMFFEAILRDSSNKLNRRKSSKDTKVGINSNQSVTEFGEFVSIISEPKLIGDRFVHLYQKNGSMETDDENSDGGITREYPNNVKTELLVRAHQCYYFSGYPHGIELVINLVKEFVNVCKKYKNDIYL